MKHQDLVERLAERTKYTKREARDFIAALSDIIVDELLNGRDVQILGLGWFRNVRRGGGRGRHWRTGERFEFEASRRVKFEPADKLRLEIKKTTHLFEPVDLEKRFGLKEVKEKK